MDANSANLIVFILMVALPLAGFLALEVFLSRRQSAWPGLVLPCSVTLGALNMVRQMALNILTAQPTLIQGVLYVTGFIIVCLVPSAAMFVIYFTNRKKVQEKQAQSKNKQRKSHSGCYADEWDFFMQRLSCTRGRCSRRRRWSLPWTRPPCPRGSRSTRYANGG